jgi:hypothetical protein
MELRWNCDVRLEKVRETDSTKRFLLQHDSVSQSLFREFLEAPRARARARRSLAAGRS